MRVMVVNHETMQLPYVLYFLVCAIGCKVIYYLFSLWNDNLLNHKCITNGYTLLKKNKIVITLLE